MSIFKICIGIQLSKKDYGNKKHDTFPGMPWIMLAGQLL
jgi:hypothetical protein